MLLLSAEQRSSPRAATFRNDHPGRCSVLAAGTERGDKKCHVSHGVDSVQEERWKESIGIYVFSHVYLGRSLEEPSVSVP